MQFPKVRVSVAGMAVAVLLATIGLVTTVSPAMAAPTSVGLRMGTTTPPPSGHCSPTGCKGTSGSGVTPNINPNNTGEKTNAKPAITYCNGRLYVGWTGLDENLNVGWGSTGGPFPANQKVTFSGYQAYQNLNASPQIYTGPALLCWQGNNGLGWQLYIAWADTNGALHVGFFDGNYQDKVIGHNYVVTNMGSVQKAYSTPALDYNVSDGYLRLAWAGTDGRINISRTTDGQNWAGQNTWLSGPHSTGGLGLAWGGTSSYGWSLYFSWIDTQSYALHLGHYNTGSATFYPDADLNNYSQQRYDASLSSIGGTFYIPYSGRAFDLNVASTSNNVWSNAEYVWASGQGASITLNSNDGHKYIVWMEVLTANPNEMDLSTFP